MTCENGAKISSISHSNGPVLVGQLRESHAEILRVGGPVWPLCVVANATPVAVATAASAAFHTHIPL